MGVGADDHDPYPRIAVTAAELAATGQADRALLVCGTGLGVAISANRGRASGRHRPRQLLRRTFDPEQQCAGSDVRQRVIGLELARRLTREWLTYQFDETSSSADKLQVLESYEMSGTR